MTPLGRVLNRFSSDTYTVDDSLPFILNILLAQIFGLIGEFIKFDSKSIWYRIFDKVLYGCF